MTEAQFIPVGRVVKSHGLKGEVSVAPTDGLPFVLQEGLQVWFVPPSMDTRDTTVTAVRQGPKGPLVTFADIRDIDAASALRGSTIMARPQDLPDEFMQAPFDPIGFEVTDVEHGLIGTLVEEIVTGANDVWVVEGAQFGQVLIPVIDECILDIDEDESVIHVKLLPGLLDSE
ncbi:MAG: ribosome maturation factor RimM [Actinomycetota bacterium]|jgi:16S rRNA processing protein RimM|nr:ribosome maturation factor RimM [Actinomycetota bacterium]